MTRSALAARSPTDKRGPWGYVTSRWSAGPPHLARTYRQRWRGEQVIEEPLNGHDLDRLVGDRLHPDRGTIGLRPLARTLAIGSQIAEAEARPAIIRAPRAFRTEHVDGLGTFIPGGAALVVTEVHPPGGGHRSYALPGTHLRLTSAA